MNVVTVKGEREKKGGGGGGVEKGTEIVNFF